MFTRLYAGGAGGAVRSEEVSGCVYNETMSSEMLRRLVFSFKISQQPFLVVLSLLRTRPVRRGGFSTLGAARTLEP